MKKILSIILSLVVAASVCTISMVPAMAKTVNSKESTTKKSTIIVEVNGGESSDVSYKTDSEDPTKITFTYDGDGELKGWDFGDLVEGVDYKILSQKGNSITIQVLNPEEIDQIVANAIVDEKNATEKTTAKNKDKGNKSPKTGATMTGVLVAGAGVAMLAALKKKSE